MSSAVTVVWQAEQKVSCFTLSVLFWSHNWLACNLLKVPCIKSLFLWISGLKELNLRIIFARMWSLVEIHGHGYSYTTLAIYCHFRSSVFHVGSFLIKACCFSPVITVCVFFPPSVVWSLFKYLNIYCICSMKEKFSEETNCLNLCFFANEIFEVHKN